MDLDTEILNSIREEFKTTKQISEELDESQTRIAIRINKLKTRNLIIEIQGKYENSRIRPMKYRLKA